jgi:short-subunit dehydrogenase
MPVAGSVAYATTKHAVVGLSASLRAEARGTGVDVSVVIPGVVDTAIFGRAINVGGYDYARAMRRVPFARLTADQAAAYILAGVSRRRAVITFPAYNRMLTGLYRVAPALTSQLVNG